MGNPLCTCYQTPVDNYLISIYTTRKVKGEKLRSLQYIASQQDLELNAYFRLFKEA